MQPTQVHQAAIRRPRFVSLLVLSLALAGVQTRADDWPQWLGPQRDGVWRETGILTVFPAAGPQVRWRTPLNAGYSGPAVADGRVFVMDRVLAPAGTKPASPFERGYIPGRERVVCMSAADGRVIWEHAYECLYTVSYPAGPRVTPTVDGDRVYTLGAEGHLFCLETATGRVVWSRDLKQDYEIKAPVWGFAGHPLVDGERLICLVGGPGSVAVAFHKETGRELWRALTTREPGYSPPMIYPGGGAQQLIIWHPEALNSLNPETGEVYWSQPFTSKAGLTAPTARRLGDLLLVTSFYNGSLAMRFAADRPAATELWRGRSRSERNTDGLHSIISTPFLEEGHIYGVCSYGQLRCLKADTGERVWETLAATTADGRETRWANAFLVKHGDRFFLPNELGEMIIARLTPAGYEELSRTKLLEPTNRDPGRLVVWSHPAFANRSVYARNDREIVCISLAAE